jgi:CP family cyanate transporter-like MFS transporter
MPARTWKSELSMMRLSRVGSHAAAAEPRVAGSAASRGLALSFKTDSAGSSAAIGVALAAGIFAAAQVGKVPTALPELQRQLDLSLVQAGWIATSINAMSAFLGVASGLVAARLGTRAALLLGLLLIAIGSLAGSLSPGSELVLGSRILEGAGFVLVVVSAPSIIAAAAPARRSAWLAAWGCYMPVGVSAMLLLAPLLVESGGWRTVWWFNTLSLAGMLALAWLQRRRLPQHPAPAPAPISTQLRRAAQLSGPWLMGLAFGVYSAQWFMIITWLPSFAVEHMGLTLRHAGWLTAFATLGNAAGCLSANPLARAGVPRWMIMVAAPLVLGGGGLVVFSSTLDPGMRLLVAVVICSVCGVLPATMFAGIPAHVRSNDQIALGNGILMQCANIGILLGPPAIAAVVSHLGGWDSGRWLFPVVAAGGVVAGLRLGRLERRNLARSC